MTTKYDKKLNVYWNGIFEYHYMLHKELIACNHVCVGNVCARMNIVFILACTTTLMLLVALTNDLHHLLMINFVPGMLYWPHAFVAYTYSIAGFCCTS